MPRSWSIEAVRAALSRTFERFVSRHQAPRVHVELIADKDLVIEPVVRGHALAGYSENLRPILRREPLASCDRPVEPPMFGPIKLAQT